jgi:hypothetical protein
MRDPKEVMALTAILMKPALGNASLVLWVYLSEA